MLYRAGRCKYTGEIVFSCYAKVTVFQQSRRWSSLAPPAGLVTVRRHRTAELPLPAVVLAELRQQLVGLVGGSVRPQYPVSRVRCKNTQHRCRSQWSQHCLCLGNSQVRVDAPTALLMHIHKPCRYRRSRHTSNSAAFTGNVLTNTVAGIKGLLNPVSMVAVDIDVQHGA